MSNTIAAALIPNLYIAADIVSRELTGFYPAFQQDPGFERAAKGQVVYSHVAPASTAQDIVPGVTSPDAGDQTIGAIPITITKSRMVPIRWNGEEARSLNNGNGVGQQRILVDQLAQAIRTLVNEVEADCAACAYQYTSRAFGTPGTTPFATDLSPLAAAMKVLDDNGAPASGRQFVMDTTAASKAVILPNLIKVNESGTDTLLRQGVIGSLLDFEIRKSAKVQTPAIGTSNNAGTTNTAGYAIGATAITLAAAGTGTVLAGDFVSFTGDTNLYEVAVGGGVASLAAGGVLTLTQPGLRQALPTSAKTVTVSALSTRNIAFTRNAFIVATRQPALPPEGDSATFRTTITDPRTGITFELAFYPQFRQSQWQLGLAWGVGGLKTEHAMTVFG